MIIKAGEPIKAGDIVYIKRNRCYKLKKVTKYTKPKGIAFKTTRKNNPCTIFVVGKIKPPPPTFEISTSKLTSGKAYRDDNGKLEMHYILRLPDGVVRIFMFGGKKYLPWNYKMGDGLPLKSFVDAGLRHLKKWDDGEENDVESGENHIDHVIANFIMMRDNMLLGRGEDYRFKDN